MTLVKSLERNFLWSVEYETESFKFESVEDGRNKFEKIVCGR